MEFNSPLSRHDESGAHDAPLLYTEADDFLWSPAERAREAEVPALSSYCTSVKSWFRKYKYPLLVVVLNVVALGLLHVLVPAAAMEKMMMRWKYSRRKDDNPDGAEPDPDDEAAIKLLDQQMKLIMTLGCFVLMGIYFLDATLFLREAKNLERRVNLEQQKLDHNNNGTDLTLDESDNSQGTERPSGLLPTSESSSPTGFGNTDNNHHKADYIQMSKSVDKAFGCPGTTGSSTFVVAFLYALFSLAAWNAASSAGMILDFQTTPLLNMSATAMCSMQGPFVHDWEGAMQKQEEEFGILSLQKAEQFPELPTDVQEWILAHKDRHNGPKFNRSVPYLQTTDGSTVFDFVRTDNSQMERRGQMKIPGLAILTKDQNLTEYVAETGKNVFVYDAEVELVGFPEGGPYTGWCSLFRLDGALFLQDEAICYNSHGDASRIVRFPPVAEEKDDDDGNTDMFSMGGGGRYDHRLYATQDKLYVASVKKLEHFTDLVMRGGPNLQETIITLVAYDVGTLEKTLVASRNITKKGGNGNSIYQQNRNHKKVNPSCKKPYAMGLAVTLPVLLGLAYYLYHLDVPSCALPFCLAVAVAWKQVFMGGPWSSIVLLGLACLCLVVLALKGGHKDNNNNNNTEMGTHTSPGHCGCVEKFVSHEMIVWALYSLILGAVWNCFAGGMDNVVDFLFMHRWNEELLIPFLVFATSFLISVLLNHPIFSILAYCFGAIACLSGLSVLGGISYLIVPIILSVLSMGCFRLSALVEQYRMHVVVYARRIFRSVRSCCCGCCCGRPSTMTVV